MFKKALNQGQAGENVGLLLRGVKREDILRGQVIAKPSTVKSVLEVQGATVRAVQRGGRPAQAVCERLPAAVLLPDRRRDGQRVAGVG